MTGWAALQLAGQTALARQAAAWADPQTAQTAALHRILQLTAGTAFAAGHGLRPGMSLSDWRQAVPVRDAAGFVPWVDRIIAGEPRVLTNAPVRVLELTGGSSGGRRVVPCTDALLEDFRAPVLAWFGDLLAGCPGIGRGRVYFAVSPALQRSVTSLGGYPVGLPSDLAYFGTEMAAHLAPLLIWHPALTVAADDAWAQATAAHLVAAADLSLISVWSPTFLSRLLDVIETDADLPLLLREGGHGLVACPDRAVALERSRDGGLDLRRLWPGLALVSAWSDAASDRPARALRARLGGVAFQPKGLLATEGLFTLPVLGLPHPLPALTGCLLEFEDATGALHLADDLRPGDSYGLVITTGGGLQRYRMGDLVTAMGPPQMPTLWPHAQPSPRLNMLRFAGRMAGCDLVGEKLDEAFVLSCLDGFPAEALLAPAMGRARGYELWVDARSWPGGPKEYLTLLDTRLRHNPQYDYARRLGQLAAPSLRQGADLLARYTECRLSLGHRLSDIKPPILLPFGPLHPHHWADDKKEG